MRLEGERTLLAPLRSGIKVRYANVSRGKDRGFDYIYLSASKGGSGLVSSSLLS